MLKCPARNNTLLTVDFNLRIGDAACHVSTKSRRDGTIYARCRPVRDKMLVEIEMTPHPAVPNGTVGRVV